MIVSLLFLRQRGTHPTHPDFTTWDAEILPSLRTTSASENTALSITDSLLTHRHRDNDETYDDQNNRRQQLGQSGTLGC
ncbi:MAG: hypothetical protein CMJ80_17960 [Planctomycetaceae bacterium]|nr:hypothetical protein [Planctomycetaceae bacterium]